MHTPAAHLKTLLAMRLFARFVLLMTLVLGLSLAFAWAWDRSDDAVAPRAVPTTH